MGKLFALLLATVESMTFAYSSCIVCLCYRSNCAWLTRAIRGLLKLHSSSSTPTTKPHKAKLAPCECQHNRLLVRLRIVVEHVNRRLKLFRILVERYRNRRRRFSLHFNLIAAILNFELEPPS